MTKAWFPISLANSLTVTMLQKEAKSLGLEPIKRGITKREAIMDANSRKRDMSLLQKMVDLLDLMSSVCDTEWQVGLPIM